MLKNLLALSALVLFATHVPAQNSGQRLQQFQLDKNHLALEGYDPVSYFFGGPQKGSASLAHTYEGVTYYFASAQNLAKFKASPAQYEPAFGGWCGYALAVKGEKVTVDPTSYKIIGGRNVLFLNSWLYGDALKLWEKELKKSSETELMRRADAAWSKFFH